MHIHIHKYVYICMYHASSTCCKIGGCKYFWSQKTFIVPERLLSVIYERLNHHITSWCLLATCPIFGMFVVGAPLFLLISFQIRAKTNNISLLTMIFLHEIFPWFLSSHCLLCCIHVEKRLVGLAPSTAILRQKLSAFGFQFGWGPIRKF